MTADSPVYTTLLDVPVVDDPAAAVKAGAVVTDTDLVAFTDPRSIEVSNLLFENDFYPEDVITGTAVPRLVRVHPVDANFGATLTELVYDQRTAFEASRGWRVTGPAPFEEFLGPQGAEVLVMLRHAEQWLHGDGDESPEADRYYEIENDTFEAMERCQGYALDALEKVGADRWWWGNSWGDVYGHEMVAVAARDLIGTVPGWDAAAYDTCTAAWRHAFAGTPEVPGTKTFADWSAPQCAPHSVARGTTNPAG